MSPLAAEDLSWDRTLNFRRGSPARLNSIELYYDFRWLDLFPDQRAQFKNGLALARLIQDGCPTGKTPALLLTARDSVEERIIQTDSHFVVVLNLPRYLAQATANAAESYYADRLGIQALAARPEVVTAVITQLSIDDIEAWASEDATTRFDQLRRIVGPAEPGATATTPADAVAALRSLQGLDGEQVRMLTALFGEESEREARLQVLHAVTEDATGRYVTGEVLVQRTRERIADARLAMSAFQDLLDQPASDETDMQLFIENNLWLLGLDYADMRARHPIPRGTMDFILERFDGFHDLLELKSPNDPIIRAPAATDGIPPSPSAYSLSPALANALAQAHVYRDILTRNAPTVEDLYGLPHVRDPRLIIVIGKAAPLPEQSANVLRELNKSLHRVEIVPYDVLGARANAILDNVQRYLVAVEEIEEVITDRSTEAVDHLAP